VLRVRVIPTLLLKNSRLVKTTKFKKPIYVGDPINAVKIFNDKEVDELVILDISATPEKRNPNYALIKDIANEAFMPFAYGGGITNIKQIEKLINLGVEKVILNTSAYKNPKLITDAVKIFGSQSIVVSIDFKKNLFSKAKIAVECGRKLINQNAIEYVKNLENLGTGEIIINSIDKDGTMTGYDLDLINRFSHLVNVPVIASGGAGKVSDFAEAIKAGASAVTAGAMFVFNGVHRAVLISYPKYEELEKRLGRI
jgi:cyclase